MTPGSYVKRKRRPADNYFLVSNTLARDPDLSPKAKGVAMWLLSHSEEFRFSVPRIAEQMGVGEDLIKSALRELERLGYLERSEIREQGRMVGMVYELDDDPHGVGGDIAQLRAIRGFSTGGSPMAGSPTGGESGGHKKTKFQEDQGEEDQGDLSLDLDLPASDGTTVESRRVATKKDAKDEELPGDRDFDEFWELYPRKVEKQGARRIWVQLMRKAGAGAGDLSAAIIAGARRYRRERAGQPAEYTKHPTTWLNNGCWGDEPAPVRTNGSSGFRPYKDADAWG